MGRGTRESRWRKETGWKKKEMRRKSEETWIEERKVEGAAEEKLGGKKEAEWRRKERG